VRLRLKFQHYLESMGYMVEHLQMVLEEETKMVRPKLRVAAK